MRKSTLQITIDNKKIRKEATMKTVYLDNSATTPVKKEVLDAMLPYFTEKFGNPSSLYEIGRESKDAVNTARSQIANLIGAKDKEIYFTSSGTEADNWAVIGTAYGKKSKGNHIITTKVEHHALLHTCEFLETQGFEVTYLDIDNDGRISLKELEDAITEKTILISIMFVNNEIGTIQPIKEIGDIAKKHNVLFHTDGVQALANTPIDVKELGIDLMSISAHKIYGPKGIGALYMRKGVVINNFMHGGGQESKKRPGTENLTGIVGFGKAAEISARDLEKHVLHCKEMRDYLLAGILKKIEEIDVNGTMKNRHPGNLNIVFNYVEGEASLYFLDLNGIYVSTGSACSSTSFTASHVLKALGIPIEKALCSIRFTVGDFTTKEDIDYTVEKLTEMVTKYRAFSTLSKDKKQI